MIITGYKIKKPTYKTVIHKKALCLLMTALLYYGVLIQQALGQEVDIEGRVELIESKSPVNEVGIGGYQISGSDNKSRSNDGKSQKVLIWVESRNKKAKAGTSYTKIKVLDQVNKQFQPKLMAVPVGHKVRIKNSDPVYHNVFSLSKTKRFDVGRRSPREYVNVHFDKAGMVDVFCDIHSDMHAVIVVLPQQTVTWKKLDPPGRFRFKDLPRGHYTLHFYALGDRMEKIKVNATNKTKVSLRTVRLGY